MDNYLSDPLEHFVNFERLISCSSIMTLSRHIGRVQLKCDGTRCRTGWEVKRKVTNGVGSSTLHTTSEQGVSSITTSDAHTSAASSRLN